MEPDEPEAAAVHAAINQLMDNAVATRLDERANTPKVSIEVTEAERDLLLKIREAVEAPDKLWNTTLGNDDETVTEPIRSRAYALAAEALVIAGKAAFDYVADVQGVTGWQGSWAALKLYGDLVGVKGPYKIFKLEDALYPQYDLQARLTKWLNEPENQQWLAEQARELLARPDASYHPNVRARLTEWAAVAPERPQS